MNLSKLFATFGIRANRRPTFCPESLEGRNLLSAMVASPVADVQHAIHDVAMKGTVNGNATLGTATFDSAYDAFVPVTYTGTGQISHAGRVTVTGSHTTEILAATGYSTSAITGGKATVTTANGSTFSFTYTGKGTLIPGQKSLFNDTFDYTITGGTGRFAGASGSGVIHSTDLSGGTSTEVPFVFDLDGMISKDGWDHSHPDK